jgi:hypothetical protein
MRLIAVFLFLLMLPALVCADVKIVELKHRAAVELLEPIRELLGDGEKVQAAGSTLVLVAEGDSLNAAEKLIALLDRRLIPLVVRLKLTDQQQHVGQDTSATINLGNVSQLSTAGSGRRRHGNSDLSFEQALSIVEGSGGWFEVGKEIPYKKQWSAFTGEVSGYSEQIAYKTVAAGFWVHPLQVIDKSVLVDVEPQINRLAERDDQVPPTIRFSQLRSRIIIPLGEWYPIGGHLQQHDQVSRDIISWRTGNTETDQMLYLRIDPAAGFSP